MNIEDAKINMKVRHYKYGTGVIIEFNNNITVKFDSEFEGKTIRIMKPDVLEVIIDKEEHLTEEFKKAINSTELKKGDSVTHSEFGRGIIVERRGFFKSLVKFQNQSIPQIVLNNSLKKIDISIINDDEILDEEIDSKFKVIPSNYTDQSCYSTNAKRLLTFFRKKYSDEGMATIKSYKEGDGEIGVLIVPSKGVIVFKMFDSEFPESTYSSPLFDSLVSNQYESLRKYYYNLFMQSKSMCEFKNDGYKLLKFPLRFVLLYQNVDIEKMNIEVRKSIQLNNKNIYFKNFTTPLSSNELFSNFEIFDDKFSKIDSKQFGSIIERIVPENVTLIDIEPKNKNSIIKINKIEKFEPITGKERKFSALCLDDSQIKAINDTKPGHYLTLANPGTGKSVLLISKAYRLQSMNKNDHVLITCYNKNLAEHHTIFAEVSGMKNPRLHINTFHKFIRDILVDVDFKFIQDNNLDDEDGFSKIVDRVEALLDAGKIKTNLKAIFIDEIQLFEPKWIDICYKLLDKSSKDYYFEMYGDINQDVKSQHSKGKASWQNTKSIPSLQGRVRKLEKNYRNTDLISNYLKSMIADFNLYLIRHGITVDNESACLSSETSKKGSLRTKILLTPNSDFGKVTKTIQELINKKNADYNDIAVIYPAQKYGKHYTPVYKIKNEFDKNGIPYSFIHGYYSQPLFDCDGVVMSTIDSCLGLDFKYVILVGIHFWDFMYDEKTNTTHKLDSKELIKNPQAKYYMSEIGKKIYSACSRAREGLYIIDDLDNISPIKEILRPKSGRSYYDEY